MSPMPLTRCWEGEQALSLTGWWAGMSPMPLTRCWEREQALPLTGRWAGMPPMPLTGSRTIRRKTIRRQTTGRQTIGRQDNWQFRQLVDWTIGRLENQPTLYKKKFYEKKSFKKKKQTNTIYLQNTVEEANDKQIIYTYLLKHLSEKGI